MTSKFACYMWEGYTTAHRLELQHNCLRLVGGGGHFQRTTPQPIRHESLKLGGGDLRFVERLFLTPFWYWYLGEMVSAAPTTASSAATTTEHGGAGAVSCPAFPGRAIHPHADVGWRSPL